MNRTRCWLIGLLVGCSPVMGVDDDPRNHELQGFTEPILRVEIAAAEAGRVSAVGVRKGTIVEPGQLILSLDQSVLKARLAVVRAQAEDRSQLQASEVQIQLAQRRYDALKQIAASGSTVHELLQVEGALQIARLERESAMAALEQKQLELAEIEALLQRREVRSSISGVVTEVLFEVGEFVSAAAPQVAVIIDQRKLKVTFFLRTEEALHLRVGQKLRVTMPVVRQTAVAVVDYVGVETIANSGRVQVDLILDNTDRRYRSGVRCTLNRTSLPENTEFDRLNTASGDKQQTTPQKRN